MILKVTIHGMHCNGCRTILENELNDSELVINASVNLEEKIAIIEVDKKTKFKDIEKIIKKCGFKCTKIEET